MRKSIAAAVWMAGALYAQAPDRYRAGFQPLLQLDPNLAQAVEGLKKLKGQ